MSPQSLLADSILTSVQLASRFFPEFTDANRTKQPPGLPNHFAWCLGHCALTMHRIRERFDGTPPPASDFIQGSARGDGTRFGTEAVSFASRPIDDPAIYPSLARCIEIFNRAAESIAAAVRNLPDARLNDNIKWGAGEIPIHAAAMRMVFHNGTHTGQITDLRRALGFKPVLG